MTWQRKMIVVVMCSAACTVWSAEKPAEKAPSLEEKKLVAQLDREVPEIDFVGQGLADVLDFMRDVAGVNIFVNWRSLEEIDVNKDAPIKLHLKNAKLKDWLDSISKGLETKKGKVQFTAESGLVVIMATPDAKNPRAMVTVSLPEKKDRVFPEINLAGQELKDVFDFLRDVETLEFKIDYEALEKAGIHKDAGVTVHLKGMKLSTCIRYILEDVSAGKVPLQCVSKDGVVTVTTVPKLEKNEK
jgi:hypothetical protein